MKDCVFCEIVAGRANATVLAARETFMVVVPLGPVAAGHALSVPLTPEEEIQL